MIHAYIIMIHAYIIGTRGLKIKPAILEKKVVLYGWPGVKNASATPNKTSRT